MSRLELVTECDNCAGKTHTAWTNKWTDGNWTNGVCDWCESGGDAASDSRIPLDPDVDLAHRFDTLKIGGPTADGRIHLNGSLSGEEWHRLMVRLGITGDTE